MVRAEQSARIQAERILPFPLPAVREVVADPRRFPEWIEPLNSLEPRDDGEYLADVGYFGHPNRHPMRPFERPGEEFGIETTGNDSLIRWAISLEPAGEQETRARFVYEKGGSGTVFGASAESPVFLISVEVLSERSLERLERLVRASVDS